MDMEVINKHNLLVQMDVTTNRTYQYILFTQCCVSVCELLWAGLMYGQHYRQVCFPKLYSVGDITTHMLPTNERVPVFNTDCVIKELQPCTSTSFKCPCPNVTSRMCVQG